MKRTFTREYILSNRGCYDREQAEKLKFIDNKKITLKTLFGNLPIKDFTWFLAKKCELTLSQKRQLALHCAKQALPIYEKQYPADSRIRECIEATEKYLQGNIEIDELREKRSAAYAAAAANANANATAYDDAAAAAYAAAAYAAYAAANNAYAADYAANAAAAATANAYDDADAYKKAIWEFVKTLKS